MKVSSSIIARNIRKRINFSLFGNLEGELDFERPLFLRPGVELRDNRVYLAEENDIEKNSGVLPPKYLRSLLLFAGGKPDVLLPLFETVFVFENTPLVEIFEIVESIIFRFDSWDKDLEKLLEENGGISEILSRSDEIFKNPLVLTDKFFKVIAFSKQYAKDYPVMIMPLVGIEEKKAENAAPLQTKIKGVRSLCFNIFMDDVLSYRLFLLEYSRKIFQSDSALLEHLGGKIRRALETQYIEMESGSVITGLSGLLKRLLSGGAAQADMSALEAAETQFRKIINKNKCMFFCMAIKQDEGAVRKTGEGEVRRICEYVRELIPLSCVFEHEGEVVAVAPAPESEPENKINMMRTFLKKAGLKAGVSEAFPSLTRFPLFYKEARYVLDVLRTDCAVMSRFREAACDFILESCASRLPASLLCAPEILALRDYDAEHNSLYFKTLAVFLENGKNYTLTAKQLFIHRSTLLYRLEQISKISALDLSDNSKTWYLLLSCKLLENEIRTGK